MEDLFRTTLAVNNTEVTYHVIFDRESYIFNAENDNSNAPAFVLKREHDEWRPDAPLPEGLKEKAVDVLERYLMKQH
jgi:hypothetical protein